MIRVLAVMSVLLGISWACAAEPDDLSLMLRFQDGGDGEPIQLLELTSWKPGETAIIICDVWDAHHCRNAVLRLEQMLPRMNQIVAELRKKGVTVIHAPSDCMDAYKHSPARQRAIRAPKSDAEPSHLDAWCPKLPTEANAVYPIEQWDGGEDDDAELHRQWSERLAAEGRNPKMPWKTQSPMIEIDEQRDFITDRGSEVFRILHAHGIRQVIVMGVHTNMCVLGRPFGLRQLVRWGMRTCLIRDMTDCMYNPQRWPFVSHSEGNKRIVDYVERYVCPTISSEQILGGTEFKLDPTMTSAIASSSADSRRQAGASIQWTTLEIAPGQTKLVVDPNSRQTLWLRKAVQYLHPSDAVVLGRLHGSEDPLPYRVWWNGVEVRKDNPWVEIQPNEVDWLVVKVDIQNRPQNGELWFTAHWLEIAGVKTELAGRWEICTTDELDFSQPLLPAKFGASPSIVQIIN